MGSTIAYERIGFLYVQTEDVSSRMEKFGFVSRALVQVDV